MLKIFIYIFLFPVICFSQSKKEKFYLFTKDGDPTTISSKAMFLMITQDRSDTEHVCLFYLMDGPLQRIETYKDAKLTIQHGKYIWYNEQGKLDSICSYKNGLIDTNSQYGKSTIFFLISRNNMTFENFMPPKFGKDDSDWSSFLSKTFNPDRIRGQYQTRLGESFVELDFRVNENGNLDDIIILKSLNWKFDLETVKTLYKSPKWIPAKNNNSNVNYRLRQKFSF
ncbi:MAG: hypothetical protein RL596_1541 [Bacteroidota bacterium]|jgi:hypothetical protein